MRLPNPYGRYLVYTHELAVHPQDMVYILALFPQSLPIRRRSLEARLFEPFL